MTTCAFHLLAAHLVGDFVFQNDWMAQGKRRSSFVCAVHVAAYMAAFIPVLLFASYPAWIYPLIALEHFVQDRFGLAERWMHLFGQTGPDKWPAGPLCVDQAMHVAFLSLCLWAEAVWWSFH